MQTKIQKWGNSLALRIPKAFALNVNIEKETVVELSLDSGRIVITPVSAPGYTLEELLNGVSENSLHGETDTGDAVGEEVW
ncbi:AbrB/MazE/SpoVT family DNA-binding domain-containing protein [Desulfonema magnum]|uniref:Antidote-toxin recognition MazE domain-containing protein n=1 Tax=Desulfonema magnum TaxID=45655 RepID=A0A975BXA5_9BACT|nr:AbrB/MazE/SpoVT family DNA-binding domain-containing protein [Desulfonema magnum]QTA92844.1 Antidote-toxin recognition MazE domain-containing protein [Desulfonema magnum]